MAIPVIYKGDDTDFRGSTGFTLKVVTSSNLNLSGCTVEVEVLGYRKSFPASATGELVCPFAFTAAETQRMPLGIHAATVRVFDSKGRVRTINNSIRVKVTNSVHEAYGNDDPQEVTFAISTVDLKAYAKKEEVTVAIAEAMKDAGASVKLHALAPEVTDTTVTLKPVDGAANWVDGKVAGFEGGVLITKRRFSVEEIWASLHSVVKNETVNIFARSRGSVEIEMQRLYFDINEGCWVAFFSLSEPLTLLYTGEEGSESVWGVVGAGQGFSVLLYEETDPSSYPEFGLGYCPASSAFHGSIIEYVQEFPSAFPSDEEWFFESASSLYYWEPERGSTPARSPVVALPESADSAKARRFTLAVETDVETEKAVEWQGGEVIEAVPGASKLVPGLNVWDVAEVAPGKFRVDRASSPARSAPLTLTAPSGRVAELTVGDDLVLEVKEI